MNRLIGLVQVGGIPGNRARPITIAGVAYPGVRAASAALQCSCTRVYKLIDERRAQ